MQFLFPPPKTNVKVKKGGELKIDFSMHKILTMTKKLTQTRSFTLNREMCRI